MKEIFLEIPVFDTNYPFSVTLTGTSYCDETYKICRKKSDTAVFEYIISGSGTLICNDKTYHPKQGDTYILLPGSDHEYYSSREEPWIKIWFNASGKLIDTLVDAYKIENTVLFHCNTLPYIEKIQSTLIDRTLSINEIADKISIYFHQLIQQLSASKAPEEDILPEAKILKNYIDQNIYSDITIDKLAGLIYRSPAQTIRIFRKNFGVTPYDYYMENRIKKATCLLESTSFSVKEIAFQLGFCDEHYFSNIFRKKTGKKPTDLRKNSI